MQMNNKQIMGIVEKIMKIAKPPRPDVLEEARYRKEHREELRAEAKRILAERRKRRLQLMDKATKVAVEKYPHGTFDGEIGDSLRAACAVGYMQAQKDTIERMVEWLKVHAKDYIVNMTGSYPDAPFDAIIGEECWDELKKEMENNG